MTLLVNSKDGNKDAQRYGNWHGNISVCNHMFKI